ncbi:acyl carrier protein [Marinibactrum halimedae]|uniref:Acyl carrier protein n=1 Tax=Marinibactrum halimedae TaxID=1444977 RepID=A0AA37T664_9GAMM|nr:acyl carrier protein [Marinibactrum halimedae]MCD9460435.1 acyl carrier protein [Marinibactrum halimedae]GLS27434.1 acyl carrier protein [Marinibactrum halimedae]
MQNKDAIFQQLAEILEELFEISPEDVKPESELYGDLDIDSIDAVDMIVKLKQLTGKRFEPSEFKSVRTVQNVVDVVYDLMVSEA